MGTKRGIRVWQVGPHREAQGGISTVIRLLLQEQENQPGIRISHLATAVTGSRALKFFVMMGAWLRLLAAGLSRRVDLLHIHSSSDASLRRKSVFMDLAEFLRIPFLLHIHGSNFDKWYEDADPGTQAWIRRQLDRAEAVVALSESWYRFLAPLTTSAVHVVYNSVPLDGVVWPRLEREPGPLRLTFLGLLGRRKGSYDLLDAMHRVVTAPDALPIELKIGGDGEIDQTKAAIERLGLQNHVRYLGWVGTEQKRDLLARSDVFVLPSYHEGLPMAILEAMAAGVAILTTPINGIPEAVREGANGLFVEPGDVDGLAAAISTLAGDLDTAARLGNAGRAEVERRFNIRHATDQLLEIYRTCVIEV